MGTKKSKRVPPGTPGYHRLTVEKRIIIWTLKQERKSQEEIAKAVGCNRATICRELKRNKSRKGYRYKKAQGKADHRAAVKATKRRKFTNEMWRYAKEKLGLGWTPEQIAWRARRDGIPMVCKETLYKEYYSRQELVRQGCCPRCRSARRSSGRETGAPRSTATPGAAGSGTAWTSTSVRRRWRTAPASGTGRAT